METYQEQPEITLGENRIANRIVSLAQRLECLATSFGIRHLVIGGSTAYSALLTERQARDFDGLLLVESWNCLERLLHDPQVLCDILGINKDPSHSLMSLYIDTLKRQSDVYTFDGFRFSGTSSDGKKHSVKVLVESDLKRCLTSIKPKSLRILSTKDIRSYSHSSIFTDKTISHGAIQRYRIQPVDEIRPQDLYILHDADVYLDAGLQSEIRATLGCTTDMLATGFCFSFTDGVPGICLASDKMTLLEHKLASLARQKVLSAHSAKLPNDLTSLYSKAARFHPVYRSRMQRIFAEDLEHVLTQSPMPYTTPDLPVALSEPSGCDNDIVVCFNTDWLLNRASCWTSIENVAHMPSSLCQLDLSPLHSLGEQIRSAFSGNCTQAKVIEAASISALLKTKLPPLRNTRYFLKMMGDTTRDLDGWTKLEAVGYPRVLAPIAADTNRSSILYEYVNGVAVAELRLMLLSPTGLQAASGMSPYCQRAIIDTTVVRCQDMLHMYKATLHRVETPSTQLPNIHEFYLERLRGGERLVKLVPDRIALPVVFHTHGGMKEPEVMISREELTSLPLAINGRMYPCIGSVLSWAERTLSSHGTRRHDLAIGLGDAHGGNILLRTGSEESCDYAVSSSMIYIDFSASGFHSPWLDMAKPLYNDVAFATFYADLCGAAPAVNIHKTNDSLHVAIGNLWQHDSTGRVIFETMIKLVMMPLLETSLSDDFEVLQAALVCSAILTRSYFSTNLGHEGYENFIRNVTAGMLLTFELLPSYTGHGRDSLNAMN